jgi:uncharacterized protein YecE (DUF72 family)
MYYIYYGTVDWAGTDPLQAIYPPDLPLEWVLSYYNTQFRCVYLPYEKWSSATDPDVASWLSDTGPDFRFVLGLPNRPGNVDVRCAARFGERGVLESEVDLVWVEKGQDLRMLASLMQGAIKAAKPLYLISRDGDLTLMRQIRELMPVLGA